MTSLPLFMKKVQELNEAIQVEGKYSSKYCKFYLPNYAKIEQMLADPEVPVNLDALGVELPVEVMLKVKDKKDKKRFEENKQIKNTWDYFYTLDSEFVRDCPQEADAIYEKIIEASESEDYTPLLFKTIKVPVAFKIALKFCQDIKATNENGDTLLHLVTTVDLALLLLKSGADVHALNKNQFNPLMSHIKDASYHVNLYYSSWADKSEHYEIAKLLVRFGANTAFVNKRGHSIYTVTRNNFDWIIDFGLPEEPFVAALKRRFQIGPDCLEKIFKAYPKYKEIFKQNIAYNMLTVFVYYDDDCRYFSHVEQLKEADLIKLVKYMIKYEHRYTHDVMKFRREWVTKHAGDLLHYALKMENTCAAAGLLKTFKADPNYMKDGIPALFAAKNGKIIPQLLEHGADPFFKCDDLMFFEREDFKLEGKKIGSWLLELHRKGFDLFTPSEKTGKSFIQCLDQSSCLSTFFKRIGFIKIQISKITKQSIEVLCQSNPDIFLPIDDAGNTLLHYSDLSYSTYVCEKCSIEELKQVPNKDGVTAYDLVLEADANFGFGRKFKDPSQFRTYVSDYLAKHGDGHLAQIGPGLLKDLLLKDSNDDINWLLLKYLVEDCSISITPFLDEVIKRCRSKYFHADDHFYFLLEHGYNLADQDFLDMVSYSYLRTLKLFLDTCEDLSSFVNLFCASTLHLSKGFCEFILHERVRNLTFEGVNLFELNFFKIAFTQKHFKFFFSAGIDARNLIRTGKTPRLDFDLTLEACFGLLDFGWTVDDFKKLGVFETLEKQSNFSRVFLVDGGFASIKQAEFTEDLLPCQECSDDFKYYSDSESETE